MTGIGVPGAVIRLRLIEQLMTERVAVIEAGAGYGKSTLALQLREALGIATVQVTLGPADRDPGVLVASLRRGLAQARLSDLLAATDVADPEPWVDRLLDGLAGRDDPVLIVLDDAHHLQSAEAVGLVQRLAAGLGAPHRLLVAARGLTRVLEPLRALATGASLDTTDLTFTADEAAELLALRTGRQLGPYDLRVALEATGGWATALVLAAAAGDLGVGDAPERLAPLRGILAGLNADDRRVVHQIAHLALIAPDLCDAIAGGPGCFERLIDGGIPLARTEAGWWELPSPVAAYLAAIAPLEAATVRAAAELYAAEGEHLRALRCLLDAGLGAEAAARLADLEAGRLDDLGFSVVRDLVESLPEGAVRAHPRVLLHLARLAETAHQSDRRRQALAEAERLIPAGVSLLRELRAEQARDLMWDSRTRAEAGRLAQAVVDAAAAEEVIARARSLDVLGRLASWFSDMGPRPEAERLLRDSARLARRIGQRTWAAQALVALGSGFYFAMCRYGEALATLDEVLGLLPARHRYRAMVQNFRAEVLIEIGAADQAESALADIRAIGERTRESWIMAYAAWQEAELASYQGDAARCVGAVEAVLGRYRDTWFDEPSGVEFLAQAADYLSRVGEHTRALELLSQARARSSETEHLVHVHAAAVLARSGDPAEAEHELGQALGPAAEPQERWPLLLLRAHVARRRRDPRAREFAAEALAYCQALGHPAGPRIREPAIAAEFAPSAERPEWSVRTLGAFAVLSDGSEELPLPAGRPARLVRVLAAHGGPMATDAVIEALWPGLDLATGLNRLRNVLSRVRSACGDLIRRDEGTLRFGPAVDVDADLFEELARQALRERGAGGDRAVALARAALERYRGEFLPADGYEAWATVRRERVRLALLEMLDLLVESAEGQDDVDEAARLLGRGIDVEPHDERRYLHLARLMVSQGRTGSAMSVLRQGEAALEAAGIGVTGSFAAYAQSFR